MRPKKWLLWSLVLAAVLTATLNQTSRGQTQRAGEAVGSAATVRGRVVDATSSEGLGGAAIVLRDASGRSLRSVAADADGRFAIENAPVGECTVVARRAGFFGGGFGQRHPGEPPQHLHLTAGGVADVQLRLWPGGVVTGRITDQSGEALAGLEVVALRRILVGGLPRLSKIKTDVTDDQGTYRLSGLSPDAYAIAVPAPTAYVGITPARQQMPVGFPTVFFPSAAHAGQAQLIEVAAGQVTAGIDLRLVEAGLHRIAGTAGPASPTLQLELIPAEASSIASDLDIRIPEIHAGSGFAFIQVPPGRYRLRAIAFPARGNAVTSGGLATMFRSSAQSAERAPLAPTPGDPTLWTEQDVEVGTEDVTDVELTLSEVGRIRGQVVFESDGPPPPPRELIATAIVPIPVGGTDLHGLSASRIEPDGRFETVGLPPGRYRFDLMLPPPGRWTAGSVVVKDQPIESAVVEIDRTGLSDVVLTFTARSASVAGTVRSSSGTIDSAASVFVFPARHALWTANGTPARFRRARASVTGEYRVSGLPAGDYLVVATSAVVSASWMDPVVLEGLARSGTDLTLTTGEFRIVDLASHNGGG
jgi:hypothetical protein